MFIGYCTELQSPALHKLINWLYCVQSSLSYLSKLLVRSSLATVSVTNIIDFYFLLPALTAEPILSIRQNFFLRECRKK